MGEPTRYLPEHWPTPRLHRDRDWAVWFGWSWHHAPVSERRLQRTLANMPLYPLERWKEERDYNDSCR